MKHPLTIQVPRPQITYSLLAALTLVAACTPAPEETPTPSAAPTPSPTPGWEPPEFGGDGLPPSEGTDHNTGDTNPDGGGGDDGGDDGELPAISVVSGLFAYDIDENGMHIGSLILMNVTAGCDNLFGSVGKITPDGLYFSLFPAPTSGDETGPNWLNTYALCGTPACTSGYALVAGEYDEFGEDTWLRLERYDAHYLTVDWSSPYSAGEDLTFYNCGNIAIWSQ